MVIKLAVCRVCNPEIERILKNTPFNHLYNYRFSGTPHMYAVNIRADPKRADRKSLFAMAWRKLDGFKVGNCYACKHATDLDELADFNSPYMDQNLVHIISLICVRVASSHACIVWRRLIHYYNMVLHGAARIGTVGY